MIVETTANRFYRVNETGDANLAHLWYGTRVRKARGHAATERWVQDNTGRPELVRKAGCRIVDPEFVRGDRVRIKEAKPLPSGRSVQLVGRVDHVRDDGLIEIRVMNAGLYGGGIFKVRADEIEKVEG